MEEAHVIRKFNTQYLKNQSLVYHEMYSDEKSFGYSKMLTKNKVQIHIWGLQFRF